MTVISGRDGHFLWRSNESLEKHIALPPAHNDLDGDGTPDFLTLGGGGYRYRIEGTADGVRFPISLHAISGRTGRRIWSAEDIVVVPEKGQTSENVGFGREPQVLACRDLNGDGQLEVVIFYDLVTGNPNAHQLWLAAVSLRDRKTVWRQALAKSSDDLNFPNEVSYKPAICDLDGDGVLDLVIAVPLPQEKARLGLWSSELRTISGRDGKLLWRRPLPVQVENYRLTKAVSTPAIGNLGDDGKLQVVVLTQGWQWPDGTDLTAASVVAEVLSFDGRTGEPIWKHQHKFLNSNFFSPRVDLVDLDGDGHRAVYASVGASNNYGAIVNPDDGVVLDARGQVRPAPETPIVGTYDLGGNGKEALLLLRNGELRVTRGGAKHVLWERSGIGVVREILPGKPGQPATVVTSGESILGLDGATGKTLWRCPWQGADSLLPLSDPREPPWLISHANGSTVCRRALATTASESKSKDRRINNSGTVPRRTTAVISSPILIDCTF